MSQKILVVEDDSDSRNILVRVLENEGYSILQAADGAAALAVCDRVNPDLILLDINMPNVSGYELCKVLKTRESTKGTPVIFLTALTDTESKIKGLSDGAVDYIGKPFDRAELLARVRTQCRMQALSQALESANRELKQQHQEITKDLKAAAILQRALLPAKMTQAGRLQFAWRFEPCDLMAGDIFNVFSYDSSYVGAYMLDVSGHGVAAALLTFAVSQLLLPHSGFVTNVEHNGQQGITSPARILSRLDQEFPIERFDKYFTLVYLIMDVHTGVVRYANAGHPPPVVIRCDGRIEVLTQVSPLIGLGKGDCYAEHQLKLKPGERIVLYTDGIVEHENSDGQPFGQDRFYAFLEQNRHLPQDELLGRLLQAVKLFGPSKQRDDLSILSIELAEVAVGDGRAN